MDRLVFFLVSLISLGAWTVVAALYFPSGDTFDRVSKQLNIILGATGFSMTQIVIVYAYLWLSGRRQDQLRVADEVTRQNHFRDILREVTTHLQKNNDLIDRLEDTASRTLNVAQSRFRSGEHWSTLAGIAEKLALLQESEDPGTQFLEDNARMELVKFDALLGDIVRGFYHLDLNPRRTLDSSWRSLIALPGIAVAISTVDPEWWDHNIEWFELNKQALRRGVPIIRIFLTNGEPSESLKKVMRRQAEAGIQVNVLRADKLDPRPPIPDLMLWGCEVEDWSHPNNKIKVVAGGLVRSIQQLIEGGKLSTSTTHVTAGAKIAVPTELDVERAATLLTALLKDSERFEDIDDADGWFNYFFNDKYLLWSRQIKDPSAEREVEFLTRVINPGSDAPMLLDCGCGYGRIALPLNKRGWNVLGVDISSTLSREIQAETKESSPWLKFDPRDMRSIGEFYTGQFDAVISMFTSFGYFRTAEENRKALEAMARTLKNTDHARLILDLDNIQIVADQDNFDYDFSVDGEEFTLHQRNLVVPRGNNGRRKLTQFTLTGAQGVYSFPLDTLQLYDTRRITEDLAAVGLVVDKIYGDYDVTLSYRGDAPRMIVVAKKG